MGNTLFANYYFSASVLSSLFPILKHGGLNLKKVKDNTILVQGKVQE